MLPSARLLALSLQHSHGTQSLKLCCRAQSQHTCGVWRVWERRVRSRAPMTYRRGDLKARVRPLAVRYARQSPCFNSTSVRSDAVNAHCERSVGSSTQNCGSGADHRRRSAAADMSAGVRVEFSGKEDLPRAHGRHDDGEAAMRRGSIGADYNRQINYVGEWKSFGNEKESCVRQVSRFHFVGIQ